MSQAAALIPLAASALQQSGEDRSPQRQVAKSAGDIIVALITSPGVQIVLGMALTEYLQGVSIDKGKGKPEPLLSQELATMIEAALVSGEMIKSMGGMQGLAMAAAMFAK